MQLRRSEKEGGGGHDVYNRDRFVHEYTLYSAIKHDLVGLHRVLSTGHVQDVDRAKDRYTLGSSVGIAREALQTSKIPGFLGLLGS